MEKKVSSIEPAVYEATSGLSMRQRAEGILRKKETELPDGLPALSPQEAQQTLHELRVHQIELEMQNEELRCAQTELDTARARYFDLYDLAPIGYCTICEKGLFRETNLTAATLLGVNRGMLINQPSSRYIGKADQDLYYLLRKRLFDTGIAQALELRMVKQGGIEFWAHLSATIAQDMDGTQVCRIVLSDITERKCAQEAIEASEEKHRSLITQMKQGLAVYDVIVDKAGKTIDCRCLDANESYERLTGQKHESIVGHTLFEASSDTNLDWIERLGYTATTGESFEYEEYSQAQDKYFEGIAYSPRPKQVAVILTDITNRKKAENAALRQLELEAKIKVLNEFFTNITHEFKTPLTVILMQLELMDLFAKDEVKMHKFIQTATQNSYRLTRLVGNILDLSKIDSGFMEVRLVCCDMVSLVRDICGSVNSYVKIKLIRFSFTSSIAEKMLPTDVEKVESILLNLLSNAIKHTDKQGEISVCLQERAGGGVLLSVEDTGEGIPVDKQKIIFDRFAQVDTSLSRLTEGSGIGLTLAKSFVELLGGTLSVTSDLGKGSKFTIELPLLEFNTDQKISDVSGFNLSKKAEMEFSDLYL